jgi:hypothetical protein
VFVLFQGSIQLVNQTHEFYGVPYWLVLQVRANSAVAESLNVTASLVLSRVSRVPIGGLSNGAHRRGFTITPDLVNRVDFERVECPKCGEKLD